MKIFPTSIILNSLNIREKLANPLIPAKPTEQRKNIGNPNHPKKGSQIKVAPIKKLKDFKAIKKILANKPRDLALFTIGINTNLRASDLLRLKVGQVKDLKAGDTVARSRRRKLARPGG